ncbi:uncharacterized protein G2W53_026795 [Senna tora]|uniref:Uncharacterized protein n=1 Tax=Senna tora TaxID=362788 RepID=A0A834TG97_9FABA|nr:uncharacterized protein G2W53_026795 [Senna tora]
MDMLPRHLNDRLCFALSHTASTPSLLGCLAGGVDGVSVWLSLTRRRRRLCSALSHGVTRTRRRWRLCYALKRDVLTLDGVLLCSLARVSAPLHDFAKSVLTSQERVKLGY